MDRKENVFKMICRDYIKDAEQGENITELIKELKIGK